LAGETVGEVLGNRDAGRDVGDIVDDWIPPPTSPVDGMKSLKETIEDLEEQGRLPCD
jgi:hypothetical protein